MNKVYVFGNEYLSEDSMARQVSTHLAAEIVHCRSPDDLLEADDPVTILDVVQGIREPVLIDGHERLKTRNIVTMHDFDLGFFLNLLDELDMPKTVRIIGVPQTGVAERFASEVQAWI